LAVVNPANVAAPTVARDTTEPSSALDPTPDATLAAWFQSIVVITPTPGAQPLLPAGAADQAAVDDPAEVDPLAAEIRAFISGNATTAGPVMIALELPDASAAPTGPRPVALPALEAKPLDGRPAVLEPELIMLPTATPTVRPAAAARTGPQLPRVEIVPIVGIQATATPAATATPVATPTPTVTPPPTGPGRLWSTFRPQPATTGDHFWVGNPFADFASNRFASPSYQFGSTAGNRYRPHHGLDISNPQGTPVQSAVSGEVVHAGLDDPDLLGPYPNFYGNAVVIRLDRRLPVAGGELDVYLLYGHLSEVRVTVGQRVGPKDVVGLVGMTGIAIGPHLHVEVRLGANTYDHSVNPYLWVEPAPGNGAVAVRVLTADGRTWAGAKISIARFDGGRAVWARQIETYLDTENIGPDPSWGENGAMGDVPAGSYYLIGSINGESLRAEFTVNSGETSFVEIRTQQ
jgi:murein DD-endopeptidase MepM/ murein hydrolase activator NlpD